MIEEEFEIIKLLSKVVWMSRYEKVYYGAKVDDIDRYHGDNVLSVIGQFDSDNKKRLFDLGENVGLDIEGIWRKEFYGE